MSLVIAGVGAAVGVASAANSIANSGSGSGGGGSGGSTNDAGNAIYGVHVSTQPLQGQGNPNPKPTMMSTNSKAIKNQAANPENVPTKGAEQNAAQGKSDYQNQWADRLDRYLGYNTRELG